MPLRLDGSTGISGVDGTAGTPAYQGANTGTGIYYAANTIYAATRSNTALTIDNSGNVGIGTASPTGKLSVNGYMNDLSIQGNGEGAQFKRGDGNSFDIFIGTPTSGLGSTLGLVFRSNYHVWKNVNNTAEYARIDASGNLLVGTGNLLVGTTGATGKITTYNTFGYAVQSSASAQADYLNYGATGSLANATGSAYYWRRNYDNVIQFQFDGAGNAAKASGAGSWNAYSDERLKTNIKKISDGLNNILSLNPVSFDYKIPEAHGNKKSDKGFLAGEFEKTYPNSVVCSNSMITDAEKEFVSEEDPAKLLGFNAEFYADLVSAIQELSAKVSALEAQLNKTS